MNPLSASQDVRRTSNHLSVVDTSQCGQSRIEECEDCFTVRSAKLAATHRSASRVVHEEAIRSSVPLNPVVDTVQCDRDSVDSQVGGEIKLSMSQLTTIRWSIDDELATFRELGFDAIGLWRPKVAEHCDKTVIETVRNSSLAVSSLSFVGGFTGRNGFSFEDAMADGRDAILDAQQLGAENVIVVGGPRNWHTIRHSRRLLVAALRELSEFAGEHGVKLSLLPMHSFFSTSWTFLNSLDETVDVLSQVNSSSVGLAFDAYHLWREPRLFDRIPLLAPFTTVVQVGDSRRSPQSDSDRCFPGEGCVPLAEIVRAFHRSGYAGYFDIQVWSDDGWNLGRDELVGACRKAVGMLRAVVE